MTVTMEDAQHRLPELSKIADSGEEVTIVRNGQPALRLVPVPEAKEKRVLGRNLLGITYIAPDFDDPMSDDEAAPWGL